MSAHEFPEPGAYWVVLPGSPEMEPAIADWDGMHFRLPGATIPFVGDALHVISRRLQPPPAGSWPPIDHGRLN